MKPIPVAALATALLTGAIVLPSCASEPTSSQAAPMVVAVTDLYSLRGQSDIPDTNQAPTKKKIIVIEDLIPRSFEEQPPVVPHKTDKHAINRQENKCLECHDRPNYEKEESPKIGDSHYRDRQGRELDHLSSDRYFCTQCHVTQMDARPLVENTYQPGK